MGYTYQWKKNGSNIPGATAAALVYDPVSSDTDGNYSVLVTDAATGRSKLFGPEAIVSHWSPPNLAANARYYTPDIGVTDTGSETIYKGVVRRDDRYWGDWLGHDSSTTAVYDNIPYMFFGWRGVDTPAWNDTYITNEAWTSSDLGFTFDRLYEDEVSPAGRPDRRHLPAKCTHTVDGLDYLYIVGGLEEPDPCEVWRFHPSVGWELVAATVPFDSRDNASMGSLDGVLYIFGGKLDAEAYSDMWKSEDDGETWTLVTATAGWGKRKAMGQTLLNKDGKLWLFGGFRETIEFALIDCVNSVWTFDGTNFVEVLADGHAQWEARYFHSVIEHDGEFWIVGGHSSTADNVTAIVIVRSADGVTWTEVEAPFDNVHAPSLWSLEEGLMIAHGYILPSETDSTFSYATYLITKTTGTRVSAWADRGIDGIDLAGSGGTKPYLVDGHIADGIKSMYFGGDNYLTLAAKDAFTGSCSVLVFGEFRHFDKSHTDAYAPSQPLIGTLAADTPGIAFGLCGSGVETRQANTFGIARSLPNPSHTDCKTVAFCVKSDGTLLQWVGTEMIDPDAKLSLTNAGWSVLGSGSDASVNLIGHITALVVLPTDEITTNDVEAFDNWARNRASIAAETSALSTILPGQLLLDERKKPHYSYDESPLKMHLIADRSVVYRTGDPIDGYAPQTCLTGNGVYGATLAFSTYFPGRSVGEMSVEFSLNPDSISSMGVASCYNTLANKFLWGIQLDADGKLNWFQKIHTDPPSLTSVAELEADTWYRIMFVRTGSTGDWDIALYINGVLDSTANTSLNPWTIDEGDTMTQLFSMATAFPAFVGSIADVRFTSDDELPWYIPLIEGDGFELHAWRADGLGVRASNIGDVGIWAGTMTTASSMVQNWAIEHGAAVNGAGVLVPGFNQEVPNTNPISHFPNTLSVGTLDCDPLGDDVGLGLEHALTKSTDRNTASSGTRRRRLSRDGVDRISAKSTAMTDDTYFND